jgi:hypothetical protein
MTQNVQHAICNIGSLDVGPLEQFDHKQNDVQEVDG